LACFAVAVYAWGFGFYGQSVYLAELQRMHGWSTLTISAATTLFYLAGAVLVIRLHAAMERLGPRAVLIGGTVSLGGGAALFSAATAPWHLYLGALVMAVGWSGTTMAAISITLARWFDRQRGLAISLALNGASAAGFLVTPLLSTFTARYGLASAVATTAMALAAIVIPLVVLGVPRRSPVPSIAGGTSGSEGHDSAYGGNAAALRDWHFWSVALPFALVLMAQVGFLVHLVAVLQPRLGAGGAASAVAAAALAAMLGRIGLGLIIDRLDQRRTSAVSFACQALALAIILALPTAPAALYAACVLFGLSVGNVITLPSLIIQREFDRRSFALVVGLSTGVAQVTYAFGPALLGLIRDLAGDYRPALVACMLLELTAAALIARKPSRC
jgi:MFS family permease